MGRKVKNKQKSFVPKKKNKTWAKALPRKVVNLDIRSTILWIT
jgi:hypothetical protein